MTHQDQHNKHYFKDMLTCEYCKKVFENPVLLPCGETICAKDVKNMYKEDTNQHLIICFFCGCVHNLFIRGSHLPPNRLVNKFLSNNLAHFSLGKTYENAKQSIEIVKNKLNEFEKLTNNPAQYLYEFFEAIETQIKHKNENLKMLSDVKCENMLKDLNLFKNECQSSLDMAIKKCLADKMEKDKLHEIGSLLGKWSDELNKPVGLNENMWNKILLESQSIQEDLSKKIGHTKACLFLNINCEFEEKHLDLKSNLFGELKLEYPELKSAKRQLNID